MAKVHVISTNAALYPLAHRLALEGHEVGYFTTDAYKEVNVWGAQAKENSNPTIVFGPPTEAADFYLLDPRGDGRFSSVLVRERKMLLGGGRLTQRCANDPSYRLQLLEGLLPSQGEESETIPLISFGLFDGERWLEPQGVAFYQSRLMEGERGSYLGPCGMTLQQVSGRLASAITPSSLTEFLRQASYRGPVHLSIRVGPEALFYDDVDFTLSSPSLLLWGELLRGSLYETFFNLSAGLLKRVVWREEVATGVKLLFAPPVQEQIEGDLISPSDFKHLWPEMGFTPPFLNLAWVTARGQDFAEARRRVYRTINMISPQPLVMYRRDIVKVLEEEAAEVKSWGWM